jgi:quinol monooxygenase YgiN
MYTTRFLLCVVAVALALSGTAPHDAWAGEKANPIVAQVKAGLKDPTRPFTLIVRLQTKEDVGAKFEAAFAKAVAPTRKEKGCLAYQLNRDGKKPANYLLYERWQNLAALEAHLKAPHITALLGEIGDLLDGPPELHVLVPAGEGQHRD